MTTSMHRIIPNRQPGITGVRESFEAMVGPYVPPEWTFDSLCSQTDPGAFFPEKGQRTREAKTICAMCPVREECLDDALAYESGENETGQVLNLNNLFGIRGGLTVEQRKPMIQARAEAVQAKRIEDVVTAYVAGAFYYHVAQDFRMDRANLKALLVERGVWRGADPEPTELDELDELEEEAS